MDDQPSLDTYRAAAGVPEQRHATQSVHSTVLALSAAHDRLVEQLRHESLDRWSATIEAFIGRIEESLEDIDAGPLVPFLVAVFAHIQSLMSLKHGLSPVLPRSSTDVTVADVSLEEDPLNHFRAAVRACLLNVESTPEITRACAFIVERLGVAVSVRELATATGCSRTKLRRLFNTPWGCPPETTRSGSAWKRRRNTCGLESR
jgi:AraC-like DNA-binding protein